MSRAGEHLARRDQHALFTAQPVRQIGRGKRPPGANKTHRRGRRRHHRQVIVVARDEIGDHRETVADQAAGTGDDFRAHLRRQRPFGQALAQHGAAHRDIFMAPPKFIDQRHRPDHPSGAQPWQAISFGQRADRDHLFGAAPKRRRFGGAVGAFGAGVNLVGEQPGAGAFGDRDKRRPVVIRKDRAGRIVGIDHRHHFDRRGDRPRQTVPVDGPAAGLVQVDGPHLGPVVEGQTPNLQIGRPHRGDHVAGADQGLGEDVIGLRRADRDQHILRPGAGIAGGDQLAQTARAINLGIVEGDPLQFGAAVRPGPIQQRRQPQRVDAAFGEMKIDALLVAGQQFLQSEGAKGRGHEGSSPRQAAAKAAALATTSAAVSPGLYKAEPRPKPAAPAAR